MKKTAIIGLLALLTITTVVFAAPALSTSDSKQVTIKSLARQVRALRAQVNTLRGQVTAARATASAAQGTANTAQATAARLDACLSRALPVTRYGDLVGTNAGTIYQGYDPDVLGQVPYIVSTNTWYSSAALDITNTGGSIDFYVALVEPGCAAGYRMAELQTPANR
jgi:outer membrane murein-binding lipoprotein Lpp